MVMKKRLKAQDVEKLENTSFAVVNAAALEDNLLAAAESWSYCPSSDSCNCPSQTCPASGTCNCGSDSCCCAATACLTGGGGAMMVESADVIELDDATVEKIVAKRFLA